MFEGLKAFTGYWSRKPILCHFIKTHAGGSATGAGVGPCHLIMFRITKAYAPCRPLVHFPSELSCGLQQSFGKRPWKRLYDRGRIVAVDANMVALNRASWINSITGLCLTNWILDGLDRFVYVLVINVMVKKSLFCHSRRDGIEGWWTVFIWHAGWQDSTPFFGGGKKNYRFLMPCRKARNYIDKIRSWPGADWYYFHWSDRCERLFVVNLFSLNSGIESLAKPPSFQEALFCMGNFIFYQAILRRI